MKKRNIPRQKVEFNYKDSEGPYEVYIVVASKTNTLLYIGHGVAGRHQHVYSGTSHVYGLNEEHFRKTRLEMVVVAFTDKELAEKVESCLIGKLSPKYNSRGTKVSEEELMALEDAVYREWPTLDKSPMAKWLVRLTPSDFRDCSEDDPYTPPGLHIGIKTFREIADEDPDRAKELDPELWSYYKVIGRKGFIACDHNRTKIKAKVKKEKQHSAFVPQERLDAHFKVGFTYRTDYIHMVLAKYFKITTGQIPWLRTHFEVKRTSQSSHTAYRILRAL